MPFHALHLIHLRMPILLRLSWFKPSSDWHHKAKASILSFISMTTLEDSPERKRNSTPLLNDFAGQAVFPVRLHQTPVTLLNQINSLLQLLPEFLIFSDFLVYIG